MFEPETKTKPGSPKQESAVADVLSKMEMQRLDQSIRDAQKKPRRAPARLTRGAKLIAGYVLLGSWSALKRFPQVGTAIRTGQLPLLKAGILFTGIAGSILLFRRSRHAKPVFLLWSAMLITNNMLKGGMFDSWTERVISGLLVGGLFFVINREVDRNVGDPHDED